MLAASCASAIPPARLADYVSTERKPTDKDLAKLDQRPLEAGLILVSDRSDPGAAPNLPDEALVRLGESLKQDIGRPNLVVIKDVIPADRIRPQPNGDWAQFAELGRQ